MRWSQSRLAEGASAIDDPHLNPSCAFAAAGSTLTEKCRDAAVYGERAPEIDKSWGVYNDPLRRLSTRTTRLVDLRRHPCYQAILA